MQTLSLCIMPIKVQIVIHLIWFAAQSIIWAGTKAYIQLTLRVRLLITWPTWGWYVKSRVKCPDDINEQRILTAPAITLSDHRAVYDAKSGRPQMVGGGWSNADTCGQGEGGMKTGHFLRTSFMDDPLTRFWSWFMHPSSNLAEAVVRRHGKQLTLLVPWSWFTLQYNTTEHLYPGLLIWKYQVGQKWPVPQYVGGP